ncbi:TAC2N protein, partial [Amia calva]|nr:TAC2N protein [Amia calva]
MAAEFIKNCCKGLMSKEKEQDPEPEESERLPGDPNFGKKRVGCSEDYLLSKLPPDGREVPFVVPSFKSSYIQPSQHYPGHQESLQGAARTTYTDRKTELSALSQATYDPDVVFHSNYILHHVSPGQARHVFPKTKGTSLYGSVWDLKSGKPLANPGLSNSMFDLSHLHGNMQRYDSVSSVRSSASSMRDSLGSSRSQESITLSGDERELGKLNVKLCYQESLEQIWITVVRCKDLPLPMGDGDLQRVSIKGIITLAKPVQFKCSIKEGSSDMEFQETFVFALKLQQLQTQGLIFKVQTHLPRKRTLGECAMTLRQLSSQEAEYWLDITPPSKAPICHAELHIATCFQPISGRIQLQILGAQNLPSSTTPMSLGFFVKIEMHNMDGLVVKKKTRVLKSSGGQVRWGETFLFPIAQQEPGLRFMVRLYSRSSVRRKQFLGQVHIGCESTTNDAIEQWRDAMTNPEKVVAVWHNLTPS